MPGVFTGFVVADPAALEGRWNYTGQLSDKTGAGDQIADDVGFIGKLDRSVVCGESHRCEREP